MNKPSLVQLNLFTQHLRLMLGTVGLLALDDWIGVTANLHALLLTIRFADAGSIDSVVGIEQQ